MKVVLINGSPHQEGNTYIALHEVAKTLEHRGIQTEIVWIGKQPIRGCIACGACKSNANGRCVFDDDVCNSISALFAGADGFVIGSPVYYGQPNGALLAVMQRAFFSNGANLTGKPAAAVAVCRRGGATASVQTMTMPFMMMHMPVVTSQYWNIVYGRDSGEAALDREGMQTMRSLAMNMATMLQTMAGQPKPEYEPRQAMNFIR